MQYAETNNKASGAILLRCGLSFLGEETHQWPEAKGGGSKQVGKYVRDFREERAEQV
jgi:hypothetical protein